MTDPALSSPTSPPATSRRAGPEVLAHPPRPPSSRPDRRADHPRPRGGGPPPSGPRARWAIVPMIRMTILELVRLALSRLRRSRAGHADDARGDHRRRLGGRARRASAGHDGGNHEQLQRPRDEPPHDQPVGPLRDRPRRSRRGRDGDRRFPARRRRARDRHAAVVVAGTTNTTTPRRRYDRRLRGGPHLRRLAGPFLNDAWRSTAGSRRRPRGDHRERPRARRSAIGTTVTIDGRPFPSSASSRRRAAPAFANPDDQVLVPIGAVQQVLRRRHERPRDRRQRRHAPTR